MSAPTKCPHCGACTTEFGQFSSPDYEDGLIIQEASCLKCEAEWHDVYVYVESIINTPGEGNAIPSEKSPTDSQ